MDEFGSWFSTFPLGSWSSLVPLLFSLLTYLKSIEIFIKSPICMETNFLKFIKFSILQKLYLRNTIT